MTRSLLYLAIAATLANAPGSCAKSGSNQSAAATGGGSAASGGNWTSLGATACAKYFTPDLTGALLANPPGTAKTLSPQACALHTDGGDISITLIADGAAGFDAFSKNLVDPRPLAGVGDKALQSMIGIAAFKAPAMVCTIDAVGAPGFVKQSGEQLGHTLGAVCNKLFAATP
jgi:hypothetical protein